MRIPRLYTQSGCDIYDGLRLRSVPDLEIPELEYRLPAAWDQVAAEVFIDKVFCKTSLPERTTLLPEDGTPSWLWRRKAVLNNEDALVMETDVRQALNRIAGGLAWQGWKNKIFDTEEDAVAFYDEFRATMLHRLAFPEIALLATSGINWAYGLPEKTFIPAQRISDMKTLSDGAGALSGLEKGALRQTQIVELALSLKDTAEGATVILPVECADSPSFIRWQHLKSIDDHARLIGRKVLEQALHRVMDACDRDSQAGFDPTFNPSLAQAIEEALGAGVEDSMIADALSLARQGFESFSLPHEEEARESLIFPVLSVPDSFVEAAMTGHSVMLFDGDSPQRRVQATQVWDDMAEAIWSSGTPAVFFRDTAVRMCKTGLENPAASRHGGLISKSGDSAPSASIDLLKFINMDGAPDADALSHVSTIMTVALDAASTTDTRPLMLGVTNIAAFLMTQGIPYDSDAGRGTAAAAIALVSATAHHASARMAASAGVCLDSTRHAKITLQAMEERITALARLPTLSPRSPLLQAAHNIWREAVELARKHGLRNSHLTGMDTSIDLQALLSATARDCAPETALVRFEASCGKSINPSAAQALRHLGYTAREMDDIHFQALGHDTLLGAPSINHITLRQKGFHQAALDSVEAALKSARHIRYAFNKWTLGLDFCQRMLGFSEDILDDSLFDMLLALGFSEREIEAANLYCCGSMTLEDAPHLQPRHFSVFDCLYPCGASARRVSPEAQIDMQAAVEVFLCGGAAQTIQLPANATVDDVRRLMQRGWEKGVKRLRLWREASPPLALARQAATIQTQAGEERAFFRKAVS